MSEIIGGKNNTVTKKLVAQDKDKEYGSITILGLKVLVRTRRHFLIPMHTCAPTPPSESLTRESSPSPPERVRKKAWPSRTARLVRRAALAYSTKSRARTCAHPCACVRGCVHARVRMCPCARVPRLPARVPCVYACACARVCACTGVGVPRCVPVIPRCMAAPHPPSAQLPFETCPVPVPHDRENVLHHFCCVFFQALHTPAGVLMCDSRLVALVRG